MPSVYQRITTFALCVGAALFCPPESLASGLMFSFHPAANMSQPAVDAFTLAGQHWSAIFGNSVTVNINIDFTALGSGILGQASSTQLAYSYGTVRNALVANRQSALDYTGDAHLAATPDFGMLINYTASNPNGAYSATPYLDNDHDLNNSQIRLTTANARALGLAVGAGTDASISFSTAFTWDFDPSDGIAAGAYDFVGVATHEIGHALGFMSGVDILDVCSAPGNPNGCAATRDDTYFAVVSPLDLFRYSTSSTSQGVIDWTADTRDKYLSVDGGATALAHLSTGRFLGNSYQASHWTMGTGIMDPAIAAGVLRNIDTIDIAALDLVGWNMAVPEPGTMGLLLAGCVGIGALRRKLG